MSSSLLLRDHPASGGRRLAVAASTVAVALVVTACAPAIQPTLETPPTAGQLRELWVEPTDIARRNLLYGPGGRGLAPRPNERFTVLERDTTGFSAGYDVRDSRGRKWKVKLGLEAQSELAASRLLWAIGYHQPPTYYVERLNLVGGDAEHVGQPARLRAEFGYDKDDDWSWHQNPYVGTRQMHGLLVANLLFNNWDFKESNNRVYTMADRRQRPARRYVVQDLGASFGMTAFPTGNRNDIDSFEQQRFIKRADAKGIEFDYGGRHEELFKGLTAADVVWTCRLLDRLSDRQMRDAFLAAGQSPEVATRYARKLRTKINEGLALAETTETAR